MPLRKQLKFRGLGRFPGRRAPPRAETEGSQGGKRGGYKYMNGPRLTVEALAHGQSERFLEHRGSCAACVSNSPREQSQGGEGWANGFLGCVSPAIKGCFRPQVS